MKLALVCMPFSSAVRPSLAIGLLAARVAEHGVSTDQWYPNLDLASELTPEVYEALCNHRGEMTGEWLFARAAFGDEAAPAESYAEKFPDEIRLIDRLAGRPGFARHLREERLPAFVDECFERADWGAYDVVGFTSTFQQNAASLALAGRIKSRFPDVTVVFGGANVDGGMGRAYLDAFPCIDFVFGGEADVTFPEFLRRLANGVAPLPLSGVSARGAFGGVPAPVDLETSPVPDFDPYFERLDALGLLGHPSFATALPFESSRGCWWGEKHHCTFCGLNGATITFRSKSPGKVLSELDALARRYRIASFEATDNIADSRYPSTLFEAMKGQGLGFELFYEVKANLGREQLRTMACAGIRAIQPGIESISTPVLKLMRKGTTGIANIALLKWSRLFGIRVEWNLLYGFAGERAEHYDRQLSALTALSHLEPPAGCFRIWLERFSPHFREPARYGVESVAPLASYELSYPERLDLPAAAYFFDYTTPASVDDEAMAATKRFVEEWKLRWSTHRPALRFRRLPSAVLIEDTRAVAMPRSTIVTEPWRIELFLEVNDGVRTFAQLERTAAAAGLTTATADAVGRQIDEWIDSRFVVEEDGKYFGVVLPVRHDADWGDRHGEDD